MRLYQAQHMQPPYETKTDSIIFKEKSNNIANQ
jgi:hypothetical protein